MNNLTLFDCTLREGVQTGGISLSVEDKIKIAQGLDNAGIHYIEGGNPASNPKDLEFFQRFKQSSLKNAKLVAFGSTRRAHFPISHDLNIKELLKAGTDVVSIFGKSWDFHVTSVLGVQLYENLNMIYDTICFLKDHGKKVIYDAEHFFDGYKSNKEYALKTIEAAYWAGADKIVLCDTNGAIMPDELYEITKLVCDKHPNLIGIHCHNDCEMAVANSIMAIKAGATQVQGTLIGCGERCGNANLATLIGNLQTKMSIDVVGDKIKDLTRISMYIADIANITLNESSPYVGRNAFAHKGGMHIDAVYKQPRTFEHIDPAIVGNERRILVSEASGKSAVYAKIKEIFPEIEKDHEKVSEITNRFKELEHMGYQFEAAEASVELVIRKALGKYNPVFNLNRFRIISEQESGIKSNLTTALISISVDGKSEITAEEGNGPVNALDKALRKAMEVFYPQIANVKLLDYKVRVVNSDATASAVRVLIESTDGILRWTTVGVSQDILKASWIALVDSLEYKIIKDTERGGLAKWQ